MDAIDEVGDMVVEAVEAKAKRPKRAPARKKGMTAEAAYSAAAVFRQLGDPGRIRILACLAEGPRNVGDIVGCVEGAQAAVSHHLKLMLLGGVVTQRREGKHSFYTLSDLGRKLSAVVSQI